MTVRQLLRGCGCAVLIVILLAIFAGLAFLWPGPQLAGAIGANFGGVSIDNPQSCSGTSCTVVVSNHKSAVRNWHTGDNIQSQNGTIAAGNSKTVTVTTTSGCTFNGTPSIDGGDTIDVPTSCSGTTASASPTAGATATSTVIQGQLQVKISASSNNVTVGTPVQVTARASDSDATVTNVTFSINGMTAGSSTSNGNNTWVLDVPTISSGTFNIAVTATDSTGATSSDSTSVTVTSSTDSNQNNGQICHATPNSDGMLLAGNTSITVPDGDWGTIEWYKKSGDPEKDSVVGPGTYNVTGLSGKYWIDVDCATQKQVDDMVETHIQQRLNDGANNVGVIVPFNP